MIVNQNVKRLREYRKLSGRSFGSKAKMNQQTLLNIEAGKSFKVDHIYKLIRIEPNLNLNWLFFNKGQMIITDENQSMVAEPEATYNNDCAQNCPETMKRIDELNRTIDILEKQNSMLHKLVEKKIDLK